MSTGTIQYRVAFGKKDEAVEGPDDASLVVSIAAPDTALDPAAAFMSGKLKAEGDTGLWFAALKSGAVTETLRRLAQR